MTIFSIVHEGDSMDAFFWNAWGLPGIPGPAEEGLGKRNQHRLTVDLGGGNSAIVASYAVGGSRIQENPGDLNDRVAALNALVAGDYPASVGARSQVYPDIRQDRHWILSIQVGTNPDSNTPAEQIGFLEAYLATLSPAWNVVLATVPSRTDNTVVPGGSTLFDTTYAQPYNALVKAGGWKEAHGVSAIADIASAAELGATGAADNTTYYDDKIHVKAAGAAIGGPILRAALDSVIAGLA